MSNIPPFDECETYTETPHLLEQRLSRRGFLAYTILSIITAGCTPAWQAPAATRTPVTTPPLQPTTSSLQRGTLEPIRADNARRVKSLATLDPGSSWALAVAWAPSSNILAVGSTLNTVQLWDIHTRKKQTALQGHHDQVNRIAWSPDGRFIASASTDGTVRLWDGQRYTSEAVLQGPIEGTAALSIAWSPDSKRLVAGYGDGAVEVWDVASLKGHIFLGQQAPDERTKAVWGIAWSPDSRWIISPQYDGILHVWEVESGKLVQTLHSDDLPNDAQWRPDGQLLASSSDKGTVQLWQPGTFKNIATLTGGGASGWVYPLAWSPDGQLLVGGYEMGQVQLWDVGTKHVLNTWQDHTAQVWDVAWSSDGRLIASASKDGSVRLWGTT